MNERFGGAITVAGAAATGLALGFLKGDGDPLRAAVGNLSAPWLLIALVPAWWAGSWWRGALVGVAATLAGLLGFYVAVTAVLHGHLGGASGWLDEYRYVVEANRVWFRAGLLSGPLMGALGGLVGALVGRGRRLGWLGVVCGALMVAELVVVRAVVSTHLPVPGVWWAAEDWTAYLGQAVTGAALLVVSAYAGRRAGDR